MVPWLIFACYLLVSSAYLLFHLKYPLSLVAYGFNTYYFYILLLPLLPSLRGMISAELIKKIFIFLGISLLLLSLIQHITDSMIIDVFRVTNESKDLSFYGHIRAISLFMNALSCGLFYTIVAALSYFSAFDAPQRNGRKIACLACSGLLLYGVYITYMRTAYMMAVFAMTTLFLLTTLNNGMLKKFLVRLPVANALCGILVIGILWLGVNKSIFPANINKYIFKESLYTFSRSLTEYNTAELRYNSYFKIDPDSSKPKISTSVNVFRGDSFAMRIIEWKAYGSIAFHNTTSAFLGLGYTQSDRLKNLEEFYIDNTYLSVIMQIGLLGLFCIVFLVWRLWLYLAENYRYNSMSIVLFAVFSTLPIIAFFNNVLAEYFLLIVIFFMVLPRKGYVEFCPSKKMGQLKSC